MKDKIVNISLIAIAICIVGLVDPFTTAKAQLNQPLTVTLGNGYQKFSANGTFTVPAGIYYVNVRAIGAGGGSNGGATGGGGGAFAFVQRIAVTPGAGIAITVGAGGAITADGGSTSFGSDLTVAGGIGSAGGGTGATIVGLTNGAGLNIGSNIYAAGFNNSPGTGGAIGVAAFPGFQIGHIGEGGTGGVHTNGYDGQLEIYW